MREWTGRDVFMVIGGAFGVIIAVNLTMAYKAISTFPGLEVASSYTAGVGFDARRAAQEALGWEVTAGVQDGALRLAFTDATGPLRPAAISARMGRPTMAAEDRTVQLQWDGQAYAGPVDLAPGQWRIDVTAAAADGTAFSRRLRIMVAP